MTIWYVARGAGLSALILLTAATVLGAVGSATAAAPRRADRRYLLQYVHRACAGLGLLVLAVHLVAILADSYAHVGWLGALVPFTSAYRPVWVGLGSVGAYTLLGVALLGLARGRMATTARGTRIWRGLHSLAYAGWAAAIWHGFATGTDSTVAWVRLLYLACLSAVAGAVAVRLLTAGRPATADRFADRRLIEGATR